MAHSLRNKLRIAVFTGSRAEYGLLRYLVRQINNDLELELQMIVSGSHLSERYGGTISEIVGDGIQLAAEVPLSLDVSPQPTMAALCAQALAGVSKALESIEPDVLIVLGDRYETFAAASSAHLLGIPVVHLHGGESTLGAVDDRLRHSISQLSSWHFTAAEPYRQRVIAMGHAPECVFNVGPMVLDALREVPSTNRDSFERSTGYQFGEQNLLVTYHPETLLPDRGVAGFEALLAVLQLSRCHVLFTHPNADEGSDQLLRLLMDFVHTYPDRSWALSSLGQQNYIAALRLFEAMAGNSSSGIIEAPLMSMPVLNIGNRQTGRLRHGLVHDVPSEFTAIAVGLAKAFSDGHRTNWPRPSPHTNSSPAHIITSHLKSILCI